MAFQNLQNNKITITRKQIFNLTKVKKFKSSKG